MSIGGAMGCMEEMQRLRQALDSQRGALEVSSFGPPSSSPFFLLPLTLSFLSPSPDLSLSRSLSLALSLSLSLSPPLSPLGPGRRDRPAPQQGPHQRAGQCGARHRGAEPQGRRRCRCCGGKGFLFFPSPPGFASEAAAEGVSASASAPAAASGEATRTRAAAAAAREAEEDRVPPPPSSSSSRGGGGPFAAGGGCSGDQAAAAAAEAASSSAAAELRRRRRRLQGFFLLFLGRNQRVGVGHAVRGREAACGGPCFSSYGRERRRRRRPPRGPPPGRESSQEAAAAAAAAVVVEGEGRCLFLKMGGEGCERKKGGERGRKREILSETKAGKKK